MADPAREPDSFQTAVPPELLRALRGGGDSPCVCPWAGSPPGSRGADVIPQLFWEALSPAGKAGHASPSASPLQPPPASLRGSARGELRDGAEGSKAAEEGILLLTPFCRVFFLRRIWIYCLEDLIDLLLNGLYRSTRTLVNVLSPDEWQSQENKICCILLIFTAKQKLGLKRELLFLL